ncbi:hypothetical protein V9T40_003188 [Parthenolecanium corni]|uniref:Uncharacterized protein n=1 Tax=Parthenolecanium corni TaxID=536013 RepID=A0AAN9TQ47_9HEMI
MESLESDRTFVASRPSIRSTTTTVDWRSYASTNRNPVYNRNINGNFFSTSTRINRKAFKGKDRDMYVLQSTRGGTVVHCASESEYDELCL